MNNKLIAVVVVIIIIVGAAAVAVYALNDDDDKKDSLDVDASVLIYGNANNDAYIDSDDIDFIQSIIDGKTTWNKSTNPYADANLDGSIDSKDIDLVNKIINDESATIYYHNYFGEDQAISYPLTNKKICVTYWQQAEEMAILGTWDQVVVASANVTDRNGLLYDTSKVKTIGTVGSSRITEQGVETIKDQGVDLIIATPSSTVKTTCDELMKDNIDVVYLWYAASYCIPTIMTMGILMDQEERAQAYAEYCYNAEHDILQKLQDKNVSLANVIVPCCFADEQARISSAGGIDVLSGDNSGGYYLISKISNAYRASDVDSWGYSYRSVEWFVENDQRFDWIIDCESGAGFANVDGKFFTQEAYNERIETNVAYFAGTTAYKNGNIIGSTFDFLSGFSGYAMLPVICAQLYSDVFSMDDALKNLQYWFDNFTVAHVDVTTDGGYRYTGTGFNASYL